MKILAVSDQTVERMYTLAPNGQFDDISLILGCGDLSYTYLEYLMTVIRKPLAYVPGNHDPEYGRDPRSRAEGGENIDGRVTQVRGLLIGGLGGSVRYRPDGVNQYTQREAYVRAAQMLPALLLNKIRHGRSLDILITHSPPYGIHDDDTQAHTGLRAINWLIRLAKPRYHFHGHTHFYRNNLEQSETVLGGTRIVNVYPYKIIEMKDE